MFIAGSCFPMQQANAQQEEQIEQEQLLSDEEEVLVSDKTEQQSGIVREDQQKNGRETQEEQRHVFEKGKVETIEDEFERDLGGYHEFVQKVRVQYITGEFRNQSIEIEHVFFNINQKLNKGEKVILGRASSAPIEQSYIRDTYRLSFIWIILIIFFIITVCIGRKKGISSFFGLFVSIIIIAVVIVPNITNSGHPLLIGFGGAALIACASLYISHGFNKRTSLALISTLITLVFSSLLAALAVNAAKLFGLGSEEAFSLQTVSGDIVNLRGLLLVGMVIGTLGVLDDVTATQTVSVFELYSANKKLTFLELYSRSMKIGREHIASMVNTLALAYAGVALPMFLLFTSTKVLPFWVIVNSEVVAEEIIRTVVGSTALMLAVPLSTFLAAWWIRKRMLNEKGEERLA